MNNFCKNLGDSLCEEFEIKVVFISKKKTFSYVFSETANHVWIFKGNN